MWSVTAEGLTKRFGERTVVDSIDLRVRKGTLFGFLGQNGAGKSTTIRMLCGLLPRSAGAVSVCGRDPAADPVGVKRSVGYMPEEVFTYDRLTGAELLRFTGRMFGLDRDRTESRADDLLDFLEFDERDRHRLLVDCSMGMRKKIALACALIHNPPVLFLDEPFNGIDAVSCRVIREALVRAAARGRTIFFSSHVLAVVESLCEEVAILHDGRIAACGPLDEVRRARGFDDATPLEEVYVELVGGPTGKGDLEWLR